jgi:hypothetical protein
VGFQKRKKGREPKKRKKKEEKEREHKRTSINDFKRA